MARWLLADVRANAFNFANAIFVASKSNAGGAGGRNSSARARTQGRHVPASGAMGSLPCHLPRPLRHAACPLGLGSVGLAAFDDKSGHLHIERSAGGNIARMFDAREE